MDADTVIEEMAAALARAEEATREAIRQVAHAAWALLDDTEEDPQTGEVRVDRESWDSLARAVEALGALIPESEQPAQPSHAVTLFWPTHEAKP